MATYKYKKKEIFDKAKEVIAKHKLFFIEDVVAFLPIGKTKFYEFFKPDANDTNELKELLETNRVELKVSMRSKWYKSPAPALQLALMKLIATPEELRKLSMNYQDITSNGEKINSSVPIVMEDGRSYEDLKNELKPE